MAERVVLIGGPYDHCRVLLTATPRAVLVGPHAYYRIDDPDTGQPLGGYAYTPPAATDESASAGTGAQG